MENLLRRKLKKIKELISIWNPGVEYMKGDLIQKNNKKYYSRINYNLNNNPEFNTNWTEIL